MFTYGIRMNLFSINSLNLALTVEQLAPWPAQRLTPSETDHNADLLQRTQQSEDAEDRPDVRYWTAYVTSWSSAKRARHETRTSTG